MAAAEKLSIGAVIAQLRSEFPDVELKESKIRFLESEGLLEPERTASGYRKFSELDMAKLRFILHHQNQSYLPLRVIKERLSALADPELIAFGTTADELDPNSAIELSLNPNLDGFKRRFSRRELIKLANISEATLQSLESFGLVQVIKGTQHFNETAMVICQTAKQLADFGLEPRHLRAFKAAADREVGLIEQIAAPIGKSQANGAEGRADQLVADLAALSVKLHASLVRAGLEQ